MRVLLAEDDEVLGRATVGFLTSDGCTVVWARSGPDALQQAIQSYFDCIILDLGLPGLSGRECLVHLRARGQETPVLVASAYGERGLRIELLDLGADDYMVKPCDLVELSARLHAIVRRSKALEAPAAGSPPAEPLRLLALGNLVCWAGQRVELTSTEFRILKFLLRHSGRVVTRKQLESEVRGDDHGPSGNGIEVHVHHLRRKLAPELIRTVRGLGYQLNLPAWMGDPAVDAQDDGRPTASKPLSL